MIIDLKTQQLRNKKLKRNNFKLRIHNGKVKRQANKIIKILKKEYIKTGNYEVEIYKLNVSFDMSEALEYLKNSNQIKYEVDEELYIIEILKPKKKTLKKPAAENTLSTTSKEELEKSPKSEKTSFGETIEEDPYEDYPGE